MDKQDFGKLVIAIRGAYRDKDFLKDSVSMEMWYECLKDIPYEVAVAAVQMHMMTSKWTPTISELREKVVDVQADKTDWSDGWEEVQRAIRRHGYVDEKGALESMSPMTREVVKRLGWRQICSSETDELMAIRANFRMIYEQKTARAREELMLPQGFKDKAKELFGENKPMLEE